jgi:hypothetical protein
MNTLRLVFLFLLIAGQAAELPPIYILTPQADDALQGKVTITGTTAVDGLQAWALEFGYTGNPTDTWFLIAEGNTAITDAALADWDTTTLTDGNYTLRLTVRGAPRGTDATPLEQRVPVRVRNYTPIETATPQPTLPPTATTLGAAPVAALTPSPRVPTPLPTNPAELTPQDVTASVKVGGLVVVVAFALLAAYLYLRRISRR